MSDVEDIKQLGDTSPQSSWIFVDDYDETVEKKELESDSDSISVISESDDSKEVAIENKEAPENGLLVKKDDNIAKDTITILYSRLYAFSCLLLAVVLPILLNYVMHNTTNIVPTYLKEYQPERDEFSDNFLDIHSDDTKPLSMDNEEHPKPSYTDSKDSNMELINVNIVAGKKDNSYDASKHRSYSSPKEKKNENYKVNVKEVPKIEEVPSVQELNFQPIDQGKIKKTSLKHKSDARYETSTKPDVEKIKHRDYKIKNKSSGKVLSESKHYGKNNHFSDIEKKGVKREKSEYKRVKNKHDKPKTETLGKQFTERGCGKELLKLRRIIVKQEKYIRELNKSLKDRKREMKTFQYKIFQELKELKYMQLENNRFKSNFTHSVSGEWYDSYFDHRDRTRKHQQEADWFFDRAHYRHKKRISDKNWYINWMLQREDYRKRTDWQFSF